jgi:molybdate transport repressor ModE-like protein
MVKWDDLKILAEVDRLGSFSKAAQAVGISQPSVSRRMRALESLFRTRLFESETGGLALTGAGRDLAHSAARMAAEAAGAERRVVGHDTQLRGRLRFATLDATAQSLMPCLGKFSARYPGIELQVILSQDFANLSRSEAEVVLRATNSPPEAYVGRRLANHAFAVFAAPTLLERYGPTTPLEAYPWVCWADGFTDLWMTEHLPSAHVVCRVNTALGMQEAVRAGIGLGHLACLGAADDPGFVCVHPPDRTLDVGIWLLTHHDLRRSARVRTFMEFLAREIVSLRDLIEGRRGSPTRTAPKMLLASDQPGRSKSAGRKRGPNLLVPAGNSGR